jgi:hypothetical protein
MQPFFGKVLKISDDVLLPPAWSWCELRGKFRERRVHALVGARHIPGSVYHFLSVWKELVQVFHAFTIFVEEL